VVCESCNAAILPSCNAIIRPVSSPFMSDPLRSEGSRALDAAPEADRDAKIEQLLLAGLDLYFAAQYEQAINVWTRALFFDRSHARARAYIERARSALAERQRESEELLQTGVAAFHRGDGEEARRLLRAAIDGGAPPEEALPLLDQLNRLDSGANVEPPRSGRSARGASTPRAADPRLPLSPAGLTRLARPARLAMSAALLLIFASACVVAALSWRRVEWRSWLPLQQMPAATAAAPAAREILLPLPRRSETVLARARTLAAGGHLQDTMTLLDTIRPTDPEKPAADRLRTDIQRQLLALASIAPSSTPPSDQTDHARP
jgi:hypothetical protein